jgi:hypothetical protein
MPILTLGLLSLIISWVRGTPPTDLANARLRWLALPVISFVVQLAAFIRFANVLEAIAPWLHVASMGLLLVFLAANLRYRSLLFVALGVLLNLAVIGSNGGYMPVRPADMRAAGFYDVAETLEAKGHFQKSTVLDGATRLPFLGDVIHVPVPFGPDRLISAGDVFIAVGTFLFFQEALPSRRRTRLQPGQALVA